MEKILLKEADRTDIFFPFKYDAVTDDPIKAFKYNEHLIAFDGRSEKNKFYILIYDYSLKNVLNYRTIHYPDRSITDRYLLHKRLRKENDTKIKKLFSIFNETIFDFKNKEIEELIKKENDFLIYLKGLTPYFIPNLNEIKVLYNYFLEAKAKGKKIQKPMFSEKDRKRNFQRLILEYKKILSPSIVEIEKKARKMAQDYSKTIGENIAYKIKDGEIEFVLKKKSY